MQWYLVLLIILGVTALPYYLGRMIAKSMRLTDDLGSRLGIVLASISLGACMLISGWPPKRGIDLQGGVILVYEVDAEKTASSKPVVGDTGNTGNPGDTAEQPGASSTLPTKTTTGGETQEKIAADFQMADLANSLLMRLNQGGVSDLVVRPYGNQQVEVVVPNVGEAEIAALKKRITAVGYLEFRIVANSVQHAQLLALADQPNQLGRSVVKDGSRVVGEWIPIDRAEDGTLRFQADPRSNKVRTNANGEQEILMAIDPYSVQGKHLHGVHSGFDPQDGSPNVSFTMSGRGANLFGRLTGDNLPKNEINHHSLLGIVLDRRLISAPRIQSRISEQGQISGNFTEAEVKDLAAVLNSGRLPAVLKPDPISEMKVSPLLGVDTIKKGQVAIVASLVSVLIFMVIYYRFAGVVAGIALLINLLLVFAIVTIIKASITMPGLAGIVLTVGMSVDSNVLIFERIREELARGCALRMAIRNGFSRASATIVDSNLTTLITAFVLYAIGTDMVKGFAVILILGILTSMFTAIFCARLVFDLAERMRWISTLRMFQFFVSPNLPVMNFRSRCMAGSAILMVASVVALGYRGKQAFDTDFNGGTRVQVAFKESIPVELVKQKVATMADSYAVFQVNSAEKIKDTEYIIDTSEQDLEKLKGLVTTAFVGANQVTQLVCHAMDFEPAQEVATPPADADAPKESTEGQGSQATVDGAFKYVRRADLPADTMLAQADTNADASTDTSAPSTATDSVVSTPSTEQAAPTEQPAEVTTTPFHSSSKLTFDESISRESIEPKMRELAQSMEIADLEFELEAVGSASGDGASAKSWQLRSTASSQQLTQLLEKYQSSVMGEPVWYGSSKIGSRVAGDMKSKALMAFLVSCIGITGYVWVRFHRIVYGLAAVAALVHDVVITVGAVAASVWLAQWFGFLQVVEFKISLPIVAAILTVMGYSINDTIVVFDRIREVKGRSPVLTDQMVNESINETLSRTTLTSFLTLLSVFFLYFLGGEGVHGFAFALLVGIIVGTYSSIFVAAPLLLWLSKFRYFQ